MDIVEYVDEKGRKYKAYQAGELEPLIIGPPQGLVDDLDLPEPFATNLHNILYQRGLFSYSVVKKDAKNLLGALNEALRIDVQKLTAGFFKFEKEINHD